MEIIYLCVNLTEHTRQPNGANWTEQDYFFIHLNKKNAKKRKKYCKDQEKIDEKNIDR